MTKLRRTLLGLAALALLSAHAATDEPTTPVEVVQAYLAADAAGLALGGPGVEKLLQSTTWADAPGWDAVTVTKSYSCQPGKETQGKATVDVTYENVGALSQTAFTAMPDQEKVTYTLVKMEGRWKIDEPQLQPHITPARAIAALKEVDTADARASIAELKKM